MLHGMYLKMVSYIVMSNPIGTYLDRDVQDKFLHVQTETKCDEYQ